MVINKIDLAEAMEVSVDAIDPGRARAQTGYQSHSHELQEGTGLDEVVKALLAV